MTVVVYVPGAVVGVKTETGVVPPGTDGVPVNVYGVLAVPGTDVVM